MKSDVPNQNKKDEKKQKRTFYFDLPQDILEEIGRLAKLHGMTRDEMTQFCFVKGIELYEEMK